MTEDQEELLDQILADYLARQEAGEAVDPEELILAHPDLADDIREFLVDQQQIAGLASPVISSIYVSSSNFVASRMRSPVPD